MPVPLLTAVIPVTCLSHEQHLSSTFTDLKNVAWYLIDDIGNHLMLLHLCQCVLILSVVGTSLNTGLTDPVDFISKHVVISPNNSDVREPVSVSDPSTARNVGIKH